MAGVGGISCDYVTMAEYTPLLERVEHWPIDGFDGLASMKLGKGNSSFVCVAKKFGTVAAVNTWANDITALAGNVITIVDDDNVSFLNVQFDRFTYRRGPARQPGTSVATRGVVVLRGVEVQ